MNQEEFNTFKEQLKDPNKWTDHDDCHCNIHFNEGASRIWKHGKEELRSILSNVHRLVHRPEFNNDNELLNDVVEDQVTLEHIVQLWYGPNSSIYNIFYSKLDWGYRKFALFIATCYQMAYYNLDCEAMYNTIINNNDNVTLMDGLMEKDEFRKCHRDINKASSIFTRDNYGSTKSKTLWKLIQEAFNNLSRELVIMQARALTLCL